MATQNLIQQHDQNLNLPIPERTGPLPLELKQNLYQQYRAYDTVEQFQFHPLEGRRTRTHTPASQDITMFVEAYKHRIAIPEQGNKPCSLSFYFWQWPLPDASSCIVLHYRLGDLVYQVYHNRRYSESSASSTDYTHLQETKRFSYQVSHLKDWRAIWYKWTKCWQQPAGKWCGAERRGSAWHHHRICHESLHHCTIDKKAPNQSGCFPCWIVLMNTDF